MPGSVNTRKWAKVAKATLGKEGGWRKLPPVARLTPSWTDGRPLVAAAEPSPLLTPSPEPTIPPATVFDGREQSTGHAFVYPGALHPLNPSFARGGALKSSPQPPKHAREVCAHPAAHTLFPPEDCTHTFTWQSSGFYEIHEFLV